MSVPRLATSVVVAAGFLWAAQVAVVAWAMADVDRALRLLRIDLRPDEGPL